MVYKPLKIFQVYGDAHWKSFADIRAKHNENICLQTNKLVLRLDKLINSIDEKQTTKVEIATDELVKLCPFCAKQFTFARRRHHCRTCDAVLCNNCSKFLEFKSANKLVKPAKLYTDPYDRIEDRLRDRGAEGQPAIRTCEDCKRLLDQRIESIEDYYCQPKFEELYEKLRSTMNEADDFILSHATLINEHKEPTPELKHKIQDLRQAIASMGLKIKKLADQQSGKQAFLLKSISQSTMAWIKESAEFKSNRIHGAQVDRSSGWVSEQSFRLDESIDDDPILIQIRNLEEYIRQAKRADRYEEMSALEANKRDLEIEYLLQQDLKISQ